MTGPKFPTASAVLAAAKSQIGVTEKPKDSNITVYGQDFGWPGVPWCGQFVWWCFHRARVDLRRVGVAHPAFTPSFFAEAAKAGWIRPGDHDIQPGDVLFFDFIAPFNTTGIQHVGIATSRPSYGRVHTIEGNTSSGTDGSQDNGGGVFARTRSLDVIVAVVRPPYAKATASVPRPSSRVIRAGAGAAAVAGAVTAVGTAVAGSPTPHTVPVPAPRSASSPTVRITVVPAPHPKPTSTPRPTPTHASAPAQRTIVGPLRYGQTSGSVKVLQRHLGVSPTGYFGRATLRKVLAAQRTADLTADGVVGPATASAFGLAYAPANRP